MPKECVNKTARQKYIYCGFSKRVYDVSDKRLILSQDANKVLK